MTHPRDVCIARPVNLDLDITYIAVLVLFLLPLVILNGIVIRPFLQLFEERHEKLEGAIQRAEEMLEQAERRSATFEDEIRAASQRGVDARSKIRAEAMTKMNTRIEEEREKMQAKLDDALGQIATQRDAALAAVGQDAETIAETTANKLLGRVA